MDTPQEVEVWFILPAIRGKLAQNLKDLGLKQKEIAKALNLTEAAVSQYLSKKRGEETSFDATTLKDISNAAKKIADGATSREELQRLLQKVKKSRFICNVCHDQINTADSCDICYM